MSVNERNQLINEIRELTAKKQNGGFNYEQECYYGELLEKARQNNICAW